MTIHRIETIRARGPQARVPGVVTDADVLAGRLADASGRSGHADALFRPESEAEVAAVLIEATRERAPVTVQAARTSTTASAVPDGGWVLSTERLVARSPIDDASATVRVEPGVLLGELQRAVEARGWLYPPDPTSRHECTVGGTVACNASGARTFVHGATRRWVEALRVVLASGEVLALQRGRVVLAPDDEIEIVRLDGGRTRVRPPRLRAPRSRKHAAGYGAGAAAGPVDLIDLFIGSEGTLGVVSEATLCLTRLPERCLGLLVFFESDERGCAFVEEARRQGRAGQGVAPRCLEWFDAASLDLMRKHAPGIAVPTGARAAVFTEQECTAQDEAGWIERWQSLVSAHTTLEDAVLAARDERDREALRAARHAVPVAINQEAARRGMPKVGTDLAVPDEALADMMALYRRAGEDPRALLTADERAELVARLGPPRPAADAGAQGGAGEDEGAWDRAGLPRALETATFGHIGDNHLHVNFLPRDAAGLALAHAVYDHLTREAIARGGTPSAEHGIGKIKRGALRALVGDGGIAQMRAFKAALDPLGLLGRGNLFEPAE